jgi:hypothetical protein
MNRRKAEKQDKVEKGSLENIELEIDDEKGGISRFHQRKKIQCAKSVDKSIMKTCRIQA